MPGSTLDGEEEVTTWKGKVKKHIIRELLGPYKAQTWCGRRINLAGTLGAAGHPGHARNAWTGKGSSCARCLRSHNATYPRTVPLPYGGAA